jgi:hypothetical protein
VKIRTRFGMGIAPRSWWSGTAPGKARIPRRIRARLGWSKVGLSRSTEPRGGPSGPPTARCTSSKPRGRPSGIWRKATASRLGSATVAGELTESTGRRFTGGRVRAASNLRHAPLGKARRMKPPSVLSRPHVLYSGAWPSSCWHLLAHLHSGRPI